MGDFEGNSYAIHYRVIIWVTINLVTIILVTIVLVTNFENF